MFSIRRYLHTGSSDPARAKLDHTGAEKQVFLVIPDECHLQL